MSDEEIITSQRHLCSSSQFSLSAPKTTVETFRAPTQQPRKDKQNEKNRSTENRIAC